jgi:hypothetical protein
MSGSQNLPEGGSSFLPGWVTKCAAPGHDNCRGWVSIGAGLHHLALQIPDPTYHNIRRLIVGKVGDGGEEAKDKLPEMRDTVIGGIIGCVRNTIIVQAVARLLGMFTPVGAIVEAGRGIYNTSRFFVQKAEKMAEVVNSIFASITNIAQRRLAPEATYIESTL